MASHPLALGALDTAGVFKTLPLVAWMGIAAVVLLMAVAFRLGSRRAAGSRALPLELERYAGHLTDALHDVHRVMRGAIPALDVDELIKEGLFEPAHAILTASAARGEVRLSVLSPDADGTHFSMPVALGHSIESRRKFRLQIAGSFAGFAYGSGEYLVSNDTDDDDRFTPHPEARPGREYRSIVAVPLHDGDAIAGVLVVIAVQPEAFSDFDVGYIRQLGGVIDVVWAIAVINSEANQDE